MEHWPDAGCERRGCLAKEHHMDNFFPSHLLLGASRERAIVLPPQLLTTGGLLMVVRWKLIKTNDNGN